LFYGATKIFGTWLAAGAKDTPLANNVVNDRFRLPFDWEKAIREKFDAVQSFEGQKGSDSWGVPSLGMGESFKPSGHMMMMTAMNVAWMRTLNHLQNAQCNRLLWTSILATLVANTFFTYNTASKGYHSPTEIAAGLGVAAAVNLLTDGLWYLGKGVGAACSKADSVSPPSKATDGDLGDPNQSTKDGNNLVPVANSNGSSSASIVFLS
jgi:membrane-associated phospholipid phosphatase